MTDDLRQLRGRSLLRLGRGSERRTLVALNTDGVRVGQHRTVTAHLWVAGLPVVNAGSVAAWSPEGSRASGTRAGRRFD